MAQECAHYTHAESGKKVRIITKGMHQLCSYSNYNKNRVDVSDATGSDSELQSVYRTRREIRAAMILGI